MCGITGIYSLNGNPIQREEISRQIETIVHRGPNQGAVYVSGRRCCGLGVRRLSIIDVAGGHQPLANEDNSIYLVYNGETYNHQTLRVELENLGHTPKTHSDAEAVLHGYEAWGPVGVLKRLRGMFAFALWDERRQRLFLARDRFGIKPLYYSRYANQLYFASEIKAILAKAHIPRRVNPDALQAMLTIGFVPGPATMFEGIYKLPPAHYLIAQNGAVQIKKYWEVNYQQRDRISETQAVEQFLVLLKESVDMRLMSEVPLGALLSGGLDSGTLAALIVQGTHPSSPTRTEQSRSIPHPISPIPYPISHAPHPTQPATRNTLKTISIGFETPAYDEADLARKLARFIGTEHHAVTFTDDDFNHYPAIMHHLEEPQCSATALPIYKLYQACRQAGLTVVLTGEGADELLGGYHWHKGDAQARLMLALPQILRRLVAASPLPMSAAARRVLVCGNRDVALRYQDWLAIGGNDYRQKLFSDDANGMLKSPGENPLLAGWAGKLANAKTDSPLHQMLWLETQTRMADFINFEVDKMSMAGSIEARVPFLDHKLWEFCAGLPSGLKLRGRTEKYLLRQAAKGILPQATRTRRKKGLASPYARWLQAEHLPDWAETALSGASIQKAGLFDPVAVRQLRRAHQAGKPNLGALLMGVLSTQLWHNNFINEQ